MPIVPEKGIILQPRVGQEVISTEDKYVIVDVVDDKYILLKTINEKPNRLIQKIFIFKENHFKIIGKVDI